MRPSPAIKVLLLLFSSNAFAESALAFKNEIVLEWAAASETHPLGGFWKVECSDQWGLAIGPFNDEYFVTFCGSGGCFPPSTYRENTPLHNDSNYTVYDTNTLDVVGNEGQITRYVRCQDKAVNASLQPPP